MPAPAANDSRTHPNAEAAYAAAVALVEQHVGDAIVQCCLRIAIAQYGYATAVETAVETADRMAAEQLLDAHGAR